MKLLCCFCCAEDPNSDSFYYQREFMILDEGRPRSVKSTETWPRRASVGCKSRLGSCSCNYINGPLRHRENWGSIYEHPFFFPPSSSALCCSLSLSLNWVIKRGESLCDAALTSVLSEGYGNVGDWGVAEEELSRNPLYIFPLASYGSGESFCTREIGRHVNYCPYVVCI